MPDKKKGFSLPDLSLTHPLATLLLLVGVVVVGILSYHRMGVDLFPRVQFPLVSVTVTDPGDSPRGITRDIALPLEGEVASLPGILHVHSTIVSGAVVVTAVFRDSELESDTLSRVTKAVDRVRGRFPSSVRSVRIKRENPTRQPLLWILFPVPSQGAAPNDTSLKKRAEEEDFVENSILPAISRMKGLRRVDLLLPPQREIELRVTTQSLATVGGSLDSLASWLKDRSREYPAGTAASEGSQESFSVRGQALTQEGLPRLLIPLP
ncbi:MAG: efflux RND transporter permease subunit, partial [Nitrospiraceae bacterium]|nr:efflux RND transporter permease subunit [Nitrospiraceae bacterium]